jgi:beta-phosphoglucomutase-like phosphatase (HAD superfamily)
MDGLLVETEPLWLETEIGVVKRLGGTPWTEEDQLQLLGGSLNRTVRYLLDRATRPVPPETVGEWMMDGVESLVRAKGVPLQPGARELHQALRADEVPIGLVTSSQRSFMRAVLETIELDFDITVCAQDVTASSPRTAWCSRIRRTASPPGRPPAASWSRSRPSSPWSRSPAAWCCPPSRRWGCLYCVHWSERLGWE